MSAELDATNHARAVAFWQEQRAAIKQAIYDALHEALFSSRTFIRPSMLPQLADDYLDHFLAFVQQADDTAAREWGRSLCKLGVSLEALQTIASHLRHCCISPEEAGEGEIRGRLQVLDQYQAQVVLGFVQQHEKALLHEQEQLRSALQRALNAYTRQMQAAGEVAHIATSILELDALLTTVVRLIQERFQLQWVGVYLLADDRSTLQLRAKIGTSAPAVEPASQLSLAGDSLPARAVHALKPQSYHGHQGQTSQRQQVSMLALPILARDQIIGALLLHSSRRDAFLSQDISAYQVIADQLATAIQNARRYAEAQQRAAELARLNEQLRELDRMETRFLHNVSHELRTPLSVIIGYVDLLQSEQLGELNSAQREALHIVAHSAENLNELVRDIMNIVEVETRQIAPEPVTVIPLLQAEIAGFLPLVREQEKHLYTEWPPDDDLQVLATRAHVRRIFNNLLGNALKFTKAGDSITVSLYEDEGFACLQVADTGIGLTPEQCERVFERFYQATSSPGEPTRGTGLGLALVREAAEAYGGRVEASSEGLGKGAVFRVWLPLAKQS